jgi:hypothetical protein
MFEQIIEFRSDNTYITTNTMTGNNKGYVGNGTYSVSGKEIKLKQDKSNLPTTKTQRSPTPMSKLPDTMTIVSQSENTLVLRYSAETAVSGGKTIVVDIEDTFTKQ